MLPFNEQEFFLELLMIAKKNYVLNDEYWLVCCYNEIRRMFVLSRPWSA